MITIPIVIPLHHRGGKLRDNTELRYCLRSIAAHFKGAHEIVIVGKKLPEWAVGLRHLPCNGGLKSALREAAEAFPEGFFWWYDDCCMLRDATVEEMQVTPACRNFGRAQSRWGYALEKIHQRLRAESLPAWDYSRPHGPYWFDKGMVDEGFVDWPGMKAKFPWESWILSKRDWPRRHGVVKQYYGPFRNPPGAGACLLNYNDKGNTPELRSWLRVRFPDAAIWEKSESGEGRSITPLSFVHVPKAAGTSILKALGHRQRVDGTSHFPASHPQTAKNAGVNGLVFGVVRNPYDRAWSIYKFFHKSKQDRPPLDKLAEAFVSAMSPEQFWCGMDLGRLAERLPHLRPQAYYLDRDIRLLRYENLAAEWAALMDETGRSGLMLPRLQVSEGIPWQEALIPRVRGSIAEFYAEDFDRFGYEK
jgi:hypothetical protein